MQFVGLRIEQPPISDSAIEIKPVTVPEEPEKQPVCEPKKPRTTNRTTAKRK